jgi:hypothetical protein
MVSFICPISSNNLRWFPNICEATSLEYTRLSVSQDFLFRYNLSMRNRGYRLCMKRCENKCSCLRNIKKGSNCFFYASYTIYPRIFIGKLKRNSMSCETLSLCTLKMSPQTETKKILRRFNPIPQTLINT